MKTSPLDLSEQGTVATLSEDGYSYRSVVCGGHEMRRGRHYATFTLRCLRQFALLGVVNASLQPTVGDGADMSHSSQGWVLATFNGALYHADCRSQWAGQPRFDELKDGDVVVWLAPSPRHAVPTLPPPHCAGCVVQGLLLDLDAATLTVWVNGERKGVMLRPGMVQPGMTNIYQAQPVGRLEGPLRWAVDMGYGSSVAIGGPLPLPE